MTKIYSDLPAIDDLIALAQGEPEELEALKARLFQELVDNAKTEARKRRLHGTQFIINMHLQKAKTPLAACIKLSELMWESTLEMNDKMQPLRKHPDGY
jgi:hypothetical protein